jgi:hypothetical protein
VTRPGTRPLDVEEPGVSRWTCILAALLGVLALALCPAAFADTADERALAERFAPVVRLVEQTEECGPGEPYEPMDVDALFGEPTVALRGPWNAVDLLEVGPSADDLGRGLYEHHIDFPGDALNPGCGYERWAQRITADADPAVYAHVATDPSHQGRLALQYWLFYPFNDWNNLHEGDWEMVQLVMAGSHANFFDDGLHIGSSAEQGVGCDDTTGPHRELRPTVHTIPSDAEEARASFPWIAFEGRWGELQQAFFNGPTGPNLKNAVDGADCVVRRTGATGAMPSPREGRSARRRRTSSATPSRAGRRRFAAS